MINLFKVIGPLGLMLISIGIVTKKRKKQDIYYIFGGLCLLTYSAFIGDPVFIILQIVFTIAAVYDLGKQLKKW